MGSPTFNSLESCVLGCHRHTMVDGSLLFVPLWPFTPVCMRHVAVCKPLISVLIKHAVRCHGPVATLLRRRGNVVMAPWQRCYGPVATLLWARGNVVMGPWQPAKRHVRTGTRLEKTSTLRLLTDVNHCNTTNEGLSRRLAAHGLSFSHFTPIKTTRKGAHNNGKAKHGERGKSDK